jgi:TRAP-type C4-dicarboxylate transport system substrate-binding protein
MKLRCSPTLVPFLKKIKANPVVMKPGDIYTALERGVVDGYIWPAAQIREWGWEKVTKYVLEPPLPYQAIDVVLVNLDAWKKLPIELKGLLIEAAKDDEFRTVVRALEYIPRENAGLAKVGLQFIKMSDAETMKLQDAAVSALWEVLMKRDAANAKKLKGMISK